MPQITKHYEDNLITFDAGFAGLRKLALFNWIPFNNGSQPKLNLTIHLKHSEQKRTIKTIQIRCNAPDGNSMDIPENYGWYTKDIQLDKAYNIVLPPLDRIGEYQYGLAVELEYIYQEDGKAYTTYSFAKLMTTGIISSRENMTTIILTIVSTAIVTVGLTFLGQFLFSLLSKPGGTK